MARIRFTDEVSDFDMRQMLLLEERITLLRPAIGKAEARRREIGGRRLPDRSVTRMSLRLASGQTGDPRRRRLKNDPCRRGGF